MNLILLLSLFAIVSSQTQGQAGVCKRLLYSLQLICQGQIEEVTQPPIEGPPGKRGPLGRRGEIGSKGSKGIKGDDAKVDYDVINNVISERVQQAQAQLRRDLSQALSSINARIEAIENSTADDLTQLKSDLSPIKKLFQLKPERVIAGRLYFFGETERNWESARNECILLGGDLATKGIREEQTFAEIFKIAREKAHNYWIGLTDVAKEGRYEFVDGVIASTSDFFWEPGEPNGVTIDDCMHLWGVNSKKVDDTFCARSFRPLCELEFA